MNAKKKYEGVWELHRDGQAFKASLGDIQLLDTSRKNIADVTVTTISVDNEISLDLFILSHTPKQESYTSNRIV